MKGERRNGKVVIEGCRLSKTSILKGRTDRELCYSRKREEKVNSKQLTAFIHLRGR